MSIAYRAVRGLADDSPDVNVFIGTECCTGGAGQTTAACVHRYGHLRP